MKLKNLTLYLFVVSLLLLSVSQVQSVQAGTCVRKERVCTEWLPDGKCKLWAYVEVEVICGTDKKICTRKERVCTERLSDGKCKLWDTVTVEYPC